MTRRKGTPINIRGAIRRGYTIVEVDMDKLHQAEISWLGLCIETDRVAKNHFVESFMQRKFAFQSDADAAWFKLKWN